MGRVRGKSSRAEPWVCKITEKQRKSAKINKTEKRKKEDRKLKIKNNFLKKNCNGCKTFTI